jgi:hypothetical protein
VEHEDRWLLSYRGLAVIKIGIDYRLSLVLGSDVDVVVETPAWVSEGSIADSGTPRTQLVPERQDLAGALRLFGARVMSAVAFKNGGQRLVFDSGLHLTCGADPALEAWQATGPGQWRFVSLAGGDLAVWRGWGHQHDQQGAGPAPGSGSVGSPG